MKSYAQIAAAMYAAYHKSLLFECLKTGAIRGQLVLEWEQLEKDHQDAWIEAAKQAAAELALVH